MGKPRKTGSLLYDRASTSDDKGRLYYFDNAKFILIFLVVLAHFTSSMQSNAFVSVLWLVINSFHMPAMIFISGFFAKRYISKSREIKVQRIATYVILYLAGQIIFFVYRKLVFGVSLTPSLMTPYAALWFLQCLIAWYVMLPVLDYFKPAHVMIVSVLFGLLIGYEKSAAHFFSISRTFVHLPFFMAGYYIKQEHIDKLRNWKIRVAGAGTFAAVAAVRAVWPKISFTTLIGCKTPYAKIRVLDGFPPGTEWLARLGFYVAAAALIIGFLALVPRGKAIFTGLGKETMSVYILHILVYLANRQFKWYLHFMSPGGIALFCLISLAATVVFSLKPFTLPFHWLQKIKVKVRGGHQHAA